MDKLLLRTWLLLGMGGVAVAFILGCTAEARVSSKSQDALRLMADGKYEESIRVWDSVVSLCGEVRRENLATCQLTILNGKAASFLGLGDFRSAFEQWGNALRFVETYAGEFTDNVEIQVSGLHSGLSAAYDELGHYKEALAHAEEAKSAAV